MIVDAFLYAGETDMLELRMRTLADVVDVFVPVCCTLTHQGAEQPLDATTIVGSRVPCVPHVVEATPLPAGTRGGVGTPYYQQIERQHRDGIRQAAAELTDHPDDIVLVSDVDEIPSPAALERAGRLLDAYSWIVLEQRFHSGYLDWLHPQQPWLGTTISRLADLEPQRMRDQRGPIHEVGAKIVGGGWHLSWLGTDAERQTKLDTFSHAELRGRYDPASARARLEHANGEQLREMTLPELVAGPWPAPILDGTFTVPLWWESAPGIQTTIQTGRELPV